MKTYFLLLSPRFFSLLNRIQRGEEGSVYKLLIMALVALAFWGAVFFGFFKALAYFETAEGFGRVLARKLMDMVWLTFFAILIFSNIVTALSTFFLSKDLEMIHASPVSQENIFWARYTNTLVDSSWMVFFFGLPVFLAYGIVFDAGALYYLNLMAVSMPLLVLASSLGVIFTLLLVNIFPAQRTKDILILLTIMVVVILYLLFRFMRPERLVDPDAFASIVSYFASLSTPASPYLPSYWIVEVLWPRLVPKTYSESSFFLMLITSTAIASAVIASWVSNFVYGYGFSKSQEAARRIIRRGSPLDLLAYLASRPYSPASRSIIVKEIKTFFRDNTQWSQVLLLLALIVVYLYNFSVLPLKKAPIPTFYLQNFISFLNIGLASFVVASLGVRFVFPAVSLEGYSYWIIRSSPISLKRFLWTKYWIYLPPLLIVAEILIIVSNYLLNAAAFMMIISTITMFFIVLGIVALGIGLGAIYPRFETENIVQVATGFGGLTFMILSAIYVAVIVILEAWPVYTIFVAQMRGTPLSELKLLIIGLCFIGVMITNILAVMLPMRIGLDRLAAREAI
ncbi:MAG: hypothetical protein JRG97_03900 [Deltaproteobacteria bacterium]|nr:hypothetical protein [Deltaproteobacteria bacterium]MBW2051677.1 hypothetical protein [Deltaproteobacteria bacterium]MBW2140199.1 hypothetical protein [Deltaproteobacteria bacterium]MBW2323913.1 hypothetical protein [Deltaproteobacteria bacterium]